MNSRMSLTDAGVSRARGSGKACQRSAHRLFTLDECPPFDSRIPASFRDWYQSCILATHHGSLNVVGCRSTHSRSHGVNHETRHGDASPDDGTCGATVSQRVERHESFFVRFSRSRMGLVLRSI